MSIFKRTARNGKLAKNWTYEFRDENGKLRTRSSGTSDKRLAVQLLNREKDRVLSIKKGLLSPTDERFRDEGRKPLAEHVADYVSACVGKRHAAEAILGKRRSLKWFLSVAGDTFDDIRADAFDESLSDLTDAVGDLLTQYPVVGFNTFGEQINTLHVNHTLTGLAFGTADGG